MAVYQLAIAMGLGTLVSWALSKTGMTFPIYIGAMIVAAVMRNVDEFTGHFRGSDLARQRPYRALLPPDWSGSKAGGPPSAGGPPISGLSAIPGGGLNYSSPQTSFAMRKAAQALGQPA